MDRATYGLAFTLVNFFTGVPAVLVGASVVKYGVRWTMLLGSALLVIGTLWMALVTSAPWHYVVGFGTILGLGMGFSTIVPLTTVLSRWFVRIRGRAIGIAMTASGFAGYNPAFYVIMLIGVIGIIAIIFAMMPEAPSVRSSIKDSAVSD